MKEHIPNTIDNFSEHLFWDTDRSSLDIKEHAAYIIKTTVQYGLFEDWELLLKLYGLNQIAETSRNMRELDPKTTAFISLLSDIPVEQFKCYTTKPSNQAHWTF